MFGQIQPVWRKPGESLRKGDNTLSTVPEVGFLRLKQIIGDKKSNIPAIIPVSRSTWWQGVKTGRYPRPVKLGPRITVWRVEVIRTFLGSQEREGN
jgi:prophage regulatory protein